MIMDDQGEYQQLITQDLLSVIDYSQQDSNPVFDWYASGYEISLLNDIEYLQTTKAPIEISDSDGDGSVNTIGFIVEKHTADIGVDEEVRLSLSTFDDFILNGGEVFSDLDIDGMVLNVTASSTSNYSNTHSHNLVFANDIYAMKRYECRTVHRRRQPVD